MKGGMKGRFAAESMEGEEGCFSLHAFPSLSPLTPVLAFFPARRLMVPRRFSNFRRPALAIPPPLSRRLCRT